MSQILVRETYTQPVTIAVNTSYLKVSNTSIRESRPLFCIERLCIVFKEESIRFERMAVLPASHFKCDALNQTRANSLKLFIEVFTILMMYILKDFFEVSFI